MTEWKPGHPVETENDRHQWQTWRKTKILLDQRRRRARLRRIDYYPSEAAAVVIDSLTHRSVGGGYASVIDRLILDAADRLPE